MENLPAQPKPKSGISTAIWIIISILVLALLFIEGPFYILSNYPAVREYFLKRFAGVDLVVLSPAPLTLGQRPLHFDTHGAAVVMGSDTSVCLSLKENVSVNLSAAQVDAEFKQLLGGAQIRVSILTASGATMTVTSKKPSWEVSGIHSDELEACVAFSTRKYVLPVGTKISQISVSSDRPLNVLKIYWDSEKEF